MQKLKLNDLILRKQARYELKEIKNFPVIAYDTETIDGLAHLVTNSNGDHINPCSIDDCLSFLCRKSTRQHIGFFYNLKYDFQAILKWLPPEHWEQVYHDGETIYEKYSIKYIPKKLLVISLIGGKKKRTWRFYDIAQYFRMKLENAGLKYLGKGKLKHNYDLANLTMDNMTEPLFIQYCIDDAKLTYDLSKLWIRICVHQGLKTKNFCSPASVASRFFLMNTKIPTINQFLKNDNKKFQLSYAWNAVSGAFISVYQKGRFDKIYEYDINSAYPFQMSKIPDLEKGYFLFNRGAIPVNAYMGWIKVRIKIDDFNAYSYYPPFPVLRENLPNYYPVGEYTLFITLNEYNYFKGIYNITPIDGLYWTPSEGLTFPFKETIENLYNKRKESKDENVNFFIKIILNGIYGKFLEKHPLHDKESPDHGKLITGNLFNPFIASYILADSRIQVFDLMRRVDKKNIIACFTDSVLTKEPLNIGDAPELGAWAAASTGEALIIGCGVYTIRGEKIKNRFRGFKIIEGEHFNLFTLCEKYYNKNQIQVDITENITPLKSIIQKRPEDMNKIINSLKTININFDTKRLWDKYPKVAGEYLETQINSEPILHLGV